MNTPCTPRARQLIQRAEEVAKACNHSYVAAEHFAAALLQSNDFPVVNELMRRLRVKFPRTNAIEKLQSIFEDK